MHSATGGQGRYEGKGFVGQSLGGGIYLAGGSTVYIVAATVANTINNTDGHSGLNGEGNIFGSYTLEN